MFSCYLCGSVLYTLREKKDHVTYVCPGMHEDEDIQLNNITEDADIQVTVEHSFSDEEDITAEPDHGDFQNQVKVTKSKLVKNFKDSQVNQCSNDEYNYQLLSELISTLTLSNSESNYILKIVRMINPTKRFPKSIADIKQWEKHIITSAPIRIPCSISPPMIGTDKIVINKGLLLLYCLFICCLYTIENIQ